MRCQIKNILLFSLLAIVLNVTNAYAKRVISITNKDMDKNQCWLKIIAENPKQNGACSQLPEVNSEGLNCIYSGEPEVHFKEALLVCHMTKPARCNKGDFIITDGVDTFLPPALRFEIKKNADKTENVCTFLNEEKFKPRNPREE